MSGLHHPIKTFDSMPLAKWQKFKNISRSGKLKAHAVTNMYYHVLRIIATKKSQQLASSILILIQNNYIKHLSALSNLRYVKIFLFPTRMERTIEEPVFASVSSNYWRNHNRLPVTNRHGFCFIVWNNNLKTSWILTDNTSYICALNRSLFIWRMKNEISYSYTQYTEACDCFVLIVFCINHLCHVFNVSKED